MLPAGPAGSTPSNGSSGGRRRIIEIDPVASRFLVEQIEEATDRGSHLFIVQLDTPGGLGVSMREMIGMTGIARSALSPQGQVMAKGTIWQAHSAAGDIARGSRVKVTGVSGLRLTVEPIEIGGQAEPGDQVGRGDQGSSEQTPSALAAEQ